MTPRRALVTGATGGLGLALVPALIQAGYQVRATGRRPEALERLRSMGVQTIQGDLSELGLGELCADIDVVFHAAALSSPWGPEAEFRRINIDATRHLLAAAQQAQADAFVFVSSPSILAEMRDRYDLTEAAPPAHRPLNAYARSKLAAERLVLAANAAGFRAVAIRPRALIGPDDTVLAPRLLRLIERGRFPTLRGGQARVELTDVRDAASALILADKRREACGGQAINISGGRPVSMADLAMALGEAMGRPLKLQAIPMAAARPLAWLAETLWSVLPGRPEPVLTSYGLATLAFGQTFDLSVARDQLGYEPAHDAVDTARALAAAWRGP